MINQDFTSLIFRGIKKFRQITDFNGIFRGPGYGPVHIPGPGSGSCLIRITGVLLTVAVVWFIMFMVFIIF